MNDVIAKQQRDTQARMFYRLLLQGARKVGIKGIKDRPDPACLYLLLDIVFQRGAGRISITGKLSHLTHFFFKRHARQPLLDLAVYVLALRGGQVHEGGCHDMLPDKDGWSKGSTGAQHLFAPVC